MRRRFMSIVAGAALLCTACDGFIRVEGTAYEWIDAPAGAESEIHIDADVPGGVQLRALPGVAVLLLHGQDYRGVDPDSARGRADGFYQSEDVSRDDGSFSLSGVTAPRRFHVVMQARRDGYAPASASFLRHGMVHRAHVVLVRQQRAPSGPRAP